MLDVDLYCVHPRRSRRRGLVFLKELNVYDVLRWTCCSCLDAGIIFRRRGAGGRGMEEGGWYETDLSPFSQCIAQAVVVVLKTTTLLWDTVIELDYYYTSKSRTTDTLKIHHFADAVKL